MNNINGKIFNLIFKLKDNEYIIINLNELSYLDIN